MADWPKMPPPLEAPNPGLLGVRHFQIAYATNDIDAACALFRSQFGIQEFRQLAGDMHGGGYIHVELAWVGGIMIELLNVSGPKEDFFMAGVGARADGLSLRLHHYGYLLRDEAEWDAVRAEAARLGRPILHENDNKGFMRHCFVPVPELGHNLEYILPEQAGLDFFKAVPAN